MPILNLPKQKISYQEKTGTQFGLTQRPWGELCVDAIIASVHVNQNYRRSSYKNKQRNYDLFNNKIDERDFEYVTKPFEICDKQGKRIDLKFPASLQPYDIISPYFKLLLGEESKRFFNPIVMASNQEALSQKERMHKDALIQAVQEILAQSLQPEELQQPDEEILKYATYSVKDVREKQANQLLNHYKRSLDLERIFHDGWKDFLVAGEEIYCIEEIAGEPQVRKINPLEIFFILHNNSNYIDDSDVICEHNRTSVAKIIDEFYEFLTPAQIEELESLYPSTGAPFTEYAPIQNVLDELPTVDSIHTLTNYNGTGLDVYRTRWASYKRIGSFHFFDEEGNEQEIPVDETFKKDPDDAQSWIEWFWVKEYWQGIRINKNIYLKISPVKFRFTKGENLSNCKSGYVGTLCDADNSKSTSLMDRLVPWLYQYLIIWYRTELLMARNIGKISLIDTSLIPSNWDISQWLYYATAMGFGFLNSYDEGRKGERKGEVNQSTQNKSLDLSTGDAIQQHIGILQYLETKIQSTAGITPQRLGSIQNDELVGNTERAVVQSSHITESLFSVHNHTKIRVLEALLEVSKEGLLGKSKLIQYFTDDFTTMTAKIDGNELASADYDLFITNAAKDQEALNAMKQLLQAALQNDKVQMSQVASLYTSNSIAEITNALKQAEEQQSQRAQQAEEANRQHEKEIQDWQIQLRQMEMDHESSEKSLDREKDIYVAEIKALGNDAMSEEGDQSGIIIEESKLALERLKILDKDKDRQSKERLENIKAKHNQYNDDKRMKHETQMKEKELKIKEKEIAVKKIAAKKKPSSSK